MKRIIKFSELPLHDAITETWVDHSQEYGLLILGVLLVEDSLPGRADEWVVLLCDISSITSTRYTDGEQHEITDLSDLNDAQILKCSVESDLNGEIEVGIALETSEFASDSAERNYVEVSLKASTSIAYPRDR